MEVPEKATTHLYIIIGSYLVTSVHSFNQIPFGISTSLCVLSKLEIKEARL